MQRTLYTKKAAYEVELHMRHKTATRKAKINIKLHQ